MSNQLITDLQLSQKLSESPAPRVTKKQIESRIASVSFVRQFDTVTLCNIKLDNGFSVRGESACVNPENYNKEIGERIAYDNAFDKLWPLFGFLLAEDNFNSTAPTTIDPNAGTLADALSPKQPAAVAGGESTATDTASASDALTA